MSRRVSFVYDDALTRHVLRPDHPLRAVRLRYTYELLEALGAFTLEGSWLQAPRPATEEELLTVHSRPYLEAVKSFSRRQRLHETGRFNFSQGGDNPVYDGMYEASALSSGASLVAAELVAEGRADVAFSVSGGLHHAASHHASGFCVFNDPALAIRYLLGRGMRVVYIDVDAHHGDGVQHIFEDTDQVLTISLHESGMFLFPGTGHVDEVGHSNARGYSVNVPLFPYTEDASYLWAFRAVVPPLVRAFRPDVMVTQLGIDSYCTDPLSHLMLTSRGYVEVVQELSNLGLPWVATGGGGYDVGAVARCWTLAYGVMLDHDWPNKIPPQQQEVLGAEWLRDGEPTSVDNDIRERSRHFAQATVERLQQLVFPVHGLG